MEVMEDLDVYLSDFARFEQALGGEARSKLHPTRKAALARFAELGFPTANDEEWRFTNLAALTKIPFQLAGLQPPPRRRNEPLQVLSEVSLDALRLHFVNGAFAT